MWLQEHCLMGIKGTVRRTTDGHLIHANIDTDIIISEEPPTGSTKKPEELYQVIERFAQGGYHCSGTAHLVQAYITNLLFIVSCCLVSH